MGVIQTCVMVVIGIVVIILLHLFHLYYLAWVYSDNPYGNAFGVLISLGFLADMSFLLANILQIILIVLIIIQGFKRS